MKKFKLKFGFRRERRSKTQLLKAEESLLLELGSIETRHLKIEDALKMKYWTLETKLQESKSKELIIEAKLQASMNYVAIMSHDFRRSLANIVIFSDLLLTGSENSPKDEKKFLQIICDTAEKLLSRMESYLLFRKLEDKRISLKKEPKMVLELIKDIKQIFFNLRIEKLLKISLKSPGLGQKEILLEKNLFQSVLENLIQNALEADKEAPILISIYEESEKFCISIENSGEVPQDIQKSLFEKFSTSKRDGNGLGLYSAQIIIQSHGGVIEYVPLAGGTKFIIELP